MKTILPNQRINRETNQHLTRIFLLFFTTITTTVFAQDSLTFETVIPVHAIKFSPFHLINFYPTIEFSYEHRIAKKLSVQAEFGYVVNYALNDDMDYQNKRGFKSKLEMRHYFGIVPRRSFSFYGAAEGYINAVNFDRSEVRTECFDVDCENRYNRQYWYVVKYREPGASLKLGFVKYFSRFLLDINSGWALRFKTYTKPPDLPGETLNDEGWRIFNIPDETNQTILMPVLGIRAGYRFR